MAQKYKDFKPIENIINIAIKEQENENDSCFLVCGKEGRGKSTFIQDCLEYIDKVKGTETPIKNIAMDIPQFISALESNEAKSTIVLDEGIKLASINIFDRLSRALTEVFVVMRKKSFLTFIAFTNPSKIQSYFREDRIKGLFFIKKRGSVAFYPAHQLTHLIPELVRKKRTSIDAFSEFEPRFTARFPKYEGKLKEEYDFIKDENIELTLNRLKSTFGEPKAYSLAQASRLLDCTDKYLKKYVDVGLLKVKPSFTGKIIRVSETELMKFKSEYMENKAEYEAKIKEKEAKKINLEFEEDIKKYENKNEVENNKK